MKQPTAEAITHLRNRIHIIIEGTDTRLGKLFDIVLLIAIWHTVSLCRMVFYHLVYDGVYSAVVFSTQPFALCV